MRSLFRMLFTIMVAASAFMVGFELGRDQERKRIPEFQED